jgi:hypothetical protein
LATIQNTNYTHYNFFTIVVDALIAVLLLSLLALRHRQRARRKRNAAAPLG